MSVVIDYHNLLYKNKLIKNTLCLFCIHTTLIVMIYIALRYYCYRNIDQYKSILQFLKVSQMIDIYC